MARVWVRWESDPEDVQHGWPGRGRTKCGGRVCGAGRGQCSGLLRRQAQGHQNRRQLRVGMMGRQDGKSD